MASAVADKSAAVVVCAAWAASGAAGVGMPEVGSVMADCARYRAAWTVVPKPRQINQPYKVCAFDIGSG